jgi:hypothetical protein
LKRRNWREYICFRGVFTVEAAVNAGGWNRQTLAIRNLTGWGAGTHPEPQSASRRTGVGFASVRALENQPSGNRGFEGRYWCQ